MSPYTITLSATLALTTALMLLLWLIGTARRDVSLVDPFWGCGFAIVAWTAWLLNSPATTRSTLLVVLVTVWGLRLSLHLLRRNWGHDEDRRYAAMRRHHGPRFIWVSLVTVFLLQAGLLWFISWPVQIVAVARSATPLGPIDLLGVLVWSVGLFFETIGDWQLARFRRDPRNAGRVLNRGLWRWTRHPNYFGDFCVWWGVYLVAAAGGAAWTIASPVLMSLLLLRVSGVTLLEATIADRRPEYADYQARTNAFFPGPPRK